MTLIEDIHIVTPARPLLRNAALGFNDGCIHWVGSAAQSRARPTDRRLYGGGTLCLPGFVNTHNHTPLTIVRGMVEDLGFSTAYTPGIPQGHWLSEGDTYLLARLGQLELLGAGCTTVVDCCRKAAALVQGAFDTGLRAFIGGRIMDAAMT